MIHGVQIHLRGTQIVGIPPDTPSSSSKERGQLRWEEHVVLDRTLRYQIPGKDGHTVHDQPTRSRSLKNRVRDMTHASETESGGGASAMFLERGFHDFEFHFIIPAWAAPYERCRYGRTRYLITASALGAGRNGSNVIAQREAFLVQQHTADGGPLPVEMHFHDMHDALGLISIGLTSASITVGGIAALAVVHPKPPPNVNVHMVRVFIEQRYEIYNHRTQSNVAPPPEKLKVWEVGSLPRLGTHGGAITTPALWAQGVLSAAGVQPGRRLGNAAMHVYPTVQPLAESLQVDERPLNEIPDAGRYGYRIKSVVRLPDDNRLRPTTARGTRTDIRISHELGVEVLFSRTDVLDQRPDSDLYGQPKVQVFSVAKAVTIPSCAFTFDAIHLPPYSQESPGISRPPSPLQHGRRSETFTPLTTLTGTAARTPPSGSGGSSARTPPPMSSGGALSTEPDWNRFVHSLTNSLSATKIRSHGSSRAASRDTSPTRFGFRSRPSSRPSSRPASRPPSPPPVHHEGSGTSTPVVAVHRPNDMGPRSRSGTVMSGDRSAPRNLPAGTPWAVSNLPPRVGESHDMCNCGETTEHLVEAEERFLEGAPTAPGAWVDTVPQGARLPPWTPSSRPTSPTQEWLASYAQNSAPAQTPVKRDTRRGAPTALTSMNTSTSPAATTETTPYTGS